MKKVLAITANLGGFDANQSHHPQRMREDFTGAMLSFSDANFPPRKLAMHPRLQAKIPKMLGWEYFPDNDYYVWLDGSVRMTQEDVLQDLVDMVGDGELCLIRHPERNSVRAELDYMTGLMRAGSSYLAQRYENEPMEEQVKGYEADPGFQDNALYAATFFVYTRELVNRKPQFFRDWFYHCSRYSVQDQLSLPYLIQHHGVRISQLDLARVADRLPWLGQMRNRVA